MDSILVTPIEPQYFSYVQIVYAFSLFMIGITCVALLIYLWREKGVVDAVKNQYNEILQEFKLMKIKIEDNETSFNNVRTIAMNYKAAFGKDIQEMQIKVDYLNKQQQRLTKNQSYLKEKMLPHIFDVRLTDDTKKQFANIKSQLEGLSK